MEFLTDILLKDNPSKYIKENKEVIFKLIPELSFSLNFDQNNKWHIYDVFEHILHVVDNVPNNLVLRLAALFHDIGKPFVYKEDEEGVGHFYGHWDKSNEIFLSFAEKYKLDECVKKQVSNLILYHDLNIDKLSKSELNKFVKELNKEEIIMLFQLKRSDLLAQNNEFHYLLDDIDKQEIKMLNKKIN